MATVDRKGGGKPKAPDDFASILASDMFTFLIGPDEKKVVVHNRAIAGYLDVLDCMMNGDMKEATEKIARLPEVDIEAFNYFVEFCYTKGHGAAFKVVERPSSMVDVPNNEIVDSHSLLAYLCHSSRRLHCGRCGAQTSAKSEIGSSTTQCGCCCQKEHGKQRKSSTSSEARYPYCILCRDEHATDYPGICLECCEEVDKFVKSAEYNHCQLFIDSRYTAYTKILDVKLPASHCDTTVIGTHLKDISIKALSVYAKTCVFAEIYNVEDLMLICLKKLCFVFAEYKITADNVGEVAEVINYIDEHTSSNELTSQNMIASTGPEQTIDSKPALRAILIQYMLENKEIILSTDTGSALIGNGGLLAIDFARAIVGQSMG